MRTSAIVAILLATLTSVSVFSVAITINQFSVLPNRTDTTYELGFHSIRTIRITRAQLILSGNLVTQVSLTYSRAGDAPQFRRFQVGLYDENGVLLSSGSNCIRVPAGAGTATLTVALSSPLPNVDSVARVRTCVTGSLASCAVPTTCL